MNTLEGFRSPKIRRGIVMLLVASLLAVSISLAWSLFQAYRAPAPIQADSLNLVDAFHVSRLAANEYSQYI